MNQPEKSIWALKRNDLMTNSNIGIIIINWNNVSDSEQQEIINRLYKDNEKVISGMTYREYGQEQAEIIKKIPAFVEGKLEEKKEKVRQVTLF